MPFNLNETELSQLEAMETQAKNKQIGFWEIYEWLANNLIAKGVGAGVRSCLLPGTYSPFPYQEKTK